MKLKEIAVTPEVMKEVTNTILERMININMICQSGQVTQFECLLGELVTIEIKMDALMSMMEAKGTDFSDFNKYLVEAAKSGRATAINIRSMFNKQNPGRGK